jgi:metallo-beta-lactamase class B
MKRPFFTLLMMFVFAGALFADDPAAVQLARIGKGVWVHTSYAMVGGYRVDAHGLVIETKNGEVLVDTCWNDAQTEALLDRISAELHKPVILAIVTHAHDDRIGGIRTLLRKGVKVVSTPLTAEKAAAAGYPRPLPELDPILTRLEPGGRPIEVFFPGPAHTVDNVTVWVPEDAVLFGGCLVKSLDSRNLGNTADADVKAWPGAIRALMAKYPDARIVVPGHGRWGGRELLSHTLELSTKK